jgi:transposase InsO family protein
MTSYMPQGCAPSIERLCRLAGVSRAGYYRFWRKSAPRQLDTTVRDAIQRLALANGRHRGYRLITFQLRQEGLVINHKRVLRLMRQDNLLCLRRRAFVPATTDSNHSWPVVPNLARGMRLSGPDQLWVADITYIRLQEEFAYLAVILDAFSRRVIGWAMADHLEASLAVEALRMAIEARRPAPGSLIHHSDRGVQYACGDYTELLAAYHITASMSRLGNPYDNAKAERFMRTLKTEQVDGTLYRDLNHARADIGHFIEQVYNGQRLHTALGYLTPIAFEDLHRAELQRRADRTIEAAPGGAAMSATLTRGAKSKTSTSSLGPAAGDAARNREATRRPRPASPLPPTGQT